MTSESSQPSVPSTEGSTPNEANSPEPTLNRAERRALAQGKKPLPKGKISGGFQGGNTVGGQHNAAIPNKSRIPRTGHK